MGGSHAHAPGEPVGDLASPVHRLDPRAKLVGLVGVTVVAVSTPLSAWPVWACCAAALTGVAVAGGVPARAVWRRARVVLPVVLLASAFVPFARPGRRPSPSAPSRRRWRACRSCCR